MYLLLILLALYVQNNLFSMGQSQIELKVLDRNSVVDEREDDEGWVLDLETGNNEISNRTPLLLARAEKDNNQMQALKQVSRAMTKNMRELQSDIEELKLQQKRHYNGMGTLVFGLHCTTYLMLIIMCLKTL